MPPQKVIVFYLYHPPSFPHDSERETSDLKDLKTLDLRQKSCGEDEKERLKIDY